MQKQPPLVVYIDIDIEDLFNIEYIVYVYVYGVICSKNSLYMNTEKV